METRTQPDAAATGHFTVHLSGLSGFQRADGGVDDDLQTWAQTFIVSDGAPSNALWYAVGARTSVTNTGPEGASYNYSRGSKPFALTVTQLAEIAQAELVVVVYRGVMLVGWAKTGCDALLSGDSATKLKLVLMTAPTLRQAYPLLSQAIVGGGVAEAPAEYRGSLSLALKPSSELRDFVIGGRSLQLTGLQIAPVAKGWGLSSDACSMVTPPASAPVPSLPPDEVATLCKAGTADPWSYVFSLRVPGSTGTGTGSTDVIHIGTGRLAYVRTAPLPNNRPSAAEETAVSSAEAPPPPADAVPASATTTGRPASGKEAKAKEAGKPAAAAKPSAAAAAEAKAKEAEAEALKLKELHEGYEYAVQWPVSKLFLPMASVGALQAHIAAGQPMEVTVRRVLTEATDPLSDPRDSVYSLAPGRRLLEEDYASRGVAQLQLTSLITPGETTVAFTGLTVVPVAVSDEEKAADVAAQAACNSAFEEHLAQKAAAAAAAAATASAAGKSAPPVGGKAAAGKAGAAGASATAAKPGAAAGATTTSKPDAKKEAAKGIGGDKKGRPASGAKIKGDAANAAADASAAGESAASPALSPYEEAHSLLSLTLSLNKPIIARPPSPPAISTSARAIIKPRQPALSKPPRPDAVEAFRRGMAAAAETIMRQYSEVSTAASSAASSGGPTGGAAVGGSGSVVQRATIASLKESGAYDEIVASMKATSERLVREHLSDLPGARDPPGTTGHAMYTSWLFSFLSDQINLALARLMTPAPSSNATTGSAMSAAARTDLLQSKRRIAVECEMEGRYARAEAVLKTRILLAEEAAAAGLSGGTFDANVWADLGCFYLRRSQWGQAHACLREAVASDSDHVQALLALAALRSSQGVHSDAAVLGASAVRSLQERLTAVEDPTPASIDLAMAHTVLSLVLEAGGNDKEAGRSIHAAVGLLSEQCVAQGMDEDGVEATATPGAAYLLASRFLLSHRLLRLASLALTHASDAFTDPALPVPPQQQMELTVLQARAYLQSARATTPAQLDGAATAREGDNQEEAEGDVALPVSSAAQCRQVLHRVTEIDGQCSEAWELMANLHQSGLLIGAAGTSAGEDVTPAAGLSEIASLSLSVAREQLRLLQLAVASLQPDAPVQRALAICGSDVPNPFMALYLRLASLHIHLVELISADEPDSVPVLLTAARDALLRAAEVASSTADRGAGAAASTWASISCGLGRVMLLADEPVEGERWFSIANKCDPQSPVIVCWLALACIRSSPPRIQEASLLAQQALQLSDVGDRSLRTAQLLKELGSSLGSHGYAAVADKLLSKAPFKADES